MECFQFLKRVGSATVQTYGLTVIEVHNAIDTFWFGDQLLKDGEWVCKSDDGHVWLSDIDPRNRIDGVIDLVRMEMQKVLKEKGSFNSMHEAFGVIYEEFCIEVAKALHGNNEREAARELIQVASSAIIAAVQWI